MAHQEEGWPLGLQPLNGRAGLFRSHEYVFGSTSFHTLLSASATSSTDFSSDLDTQSTGSFFHDNSTTLGTLMGVSTIGNNLSDLIPRRSSSSSSSSSVAKGRPRPSEVIPGVKKKKAQLRCKTSWCFSLCPKYNTDARNTNPSNNPPSLAQFLASERRAANGNHNFIYGPDGLALAPPVVEPNSLFVNGCVAPPRSSPMLGLGLMENGDKGCGIPFLLYCVCGQDHPLN